MLRDRLREKEYDAVVVGSGPNGLAAAITVARAGLRVLVLEAQAEAGGGLRSAALTLPGFLHDVCSAIHPTALASPFFRSLALAGRGVEFVQPPAALAHPLPARAPAMLWRDLAATASALGVDGPSWEALHAPFLRRPEEFFAMMLAPLGPPAHPLRMARFGLSGLRSASALSRARFQGAAARALFAGCAAHSILPLSYAGTSAFGLMLSLSGHAVGWPCLRGGSGTLAAALCAELVALGGEVVTSAEVRSLDDLPPARAVLLDLAPRNVARICADALPQPYLRALEAFRHGPGVFKLDYALAGPIPWTDPEVGSAATVHLGGTLEEIEASERAPWEGVAAASPFVLLAQQSLFDSSRAPPGQHTAWAYCHVPHGFAGDATEAIEGQIERFAPGFRERVLARAARGPAAIERDNANCIGGDIGGGANDLAQLFARPVARAIPYATPNDKLFLCSSSTPPGGGVHGMCGYHAARAALRRRFGKKIPAT